MNRVRRGGCLVIVLGLSVLILASCGGSSKYTGTWHSEKMVFSGIEMSTEGETVLTLEINSDGTASWTEGDYTISGTWEETEDGIIVALEVLGDSIEYPCHLEDGQLIVDFNGIDIYCVQ